MSLLGIQMFYLIWKVIYIRFEYIIWLTRLITYKKMAVLIYWFKFSPKAKSCNFCKRTQEIPPLFRTTTFQAWRNVSKSTYVVGVICLTDMNRANISTKKLQKRVAGPVIQP